MTGAAHAGSQVGDRVARANARHPLQRAGAGLFEAYHPERDEQGLELLAAQLAAVVDQTEAKIDGALAELGGLRRYLARIDAKVTDGDRSARSTAC
jgi:hypothetical protein